MKDNLEASQKRAVQYWFSDGLAELSGAAICLLLAIYFGIVQILGSSQGSFALFFLMVFIVAFGIRKVMLWYRERSTYPRTGYVEPKRGWEDHRLLGIAIGFTVIFMAFMLFMILRGIQSMAWMPALVGVIFAFIFSWVGYRTKLVRFYFLAGFSLVLGVFLAIYGIGDLWGAAILSFCIGLVLFAYGIVTRRSYLDQSQVAVEQADER
jgi:hypothetical protein